MAPPDPRLFDDEDESVLQPAPPDALVFILPNLSVDDLVDLAAGIVPRHLQATARASLDFEDFIRRNAEKSKLPFGDAQ